MPEENEIIAKLDEIIKLQLETIKRLEIIEKPLFVQDGDKKKIIRLTEMCFITTNSKGLDVFTSDGKKYVNFASIGQINEEFKHDPRLMKTHKSFIVNLNLIDSVKVDSGRELTFKGLSPDIKAKVATDYVEEFEKRFGNS